MGLAVSLGFAVRALFVAVFGGQVLPSALGMDAVRGWLLARHTSAIARTAASLLADRLAALFAVCLLVMLAGLTTNQRLLPYAGLLPPAAAALSGGVLLGLVLVLHRVSAREGLKPRPVPLLAGVCIALVVHCAAVLTAVLVAAAYGIDASLELWLAVIPLSLLVSMLPVSVNGWGVREASVVMLAAPFGVPAVEALLVSLTLGVLNLVASLPGALLVLKGRRRALV